MTPKFRKGQLLIFIPNGNEVIVNYINTKRFTIVNNGRTTGFSDEFTGLILVLGLTIKVKQ